MCIGLYERVIWGMWLWSNCLGVYWRVYYEIVLRGVGSSYC